MAPFAGYDMPLHYGSQITEHHNTRNDASIFDVSHMGVIDVCGQQARSALRMLLANDLARIKDQQKGLYSCLLNEQGGIIDDLICYQLSATHYRLVVNAGTKGTDLKHIEQALEPYQLAIKPLPDRAIIALQGPKARDKFDKLATKDLALACRELSRFACVAHHDLFVGRTGYSGEDGYELILPAEQAADFWQKALSVGFAPAGLGARDTLRLEAGLNLYGQDMDQQTTPAAANLSWTVSYHDLAREFIGKKALAEQENSHVLVALVLKERGILRPGMDVYADGRCVGIITSGSFAPSLQCSIAFARVQQGVDEEYQVQIRQKSCSCVRVKAPFVKNGQATFSL